MLEEKIEEAHLVTKIRKRDGRIVDFDANKITEAIWKAAQSVGGKDRSIAEKLTKEVVRRINEKFAGKIPTVEDVQDIVEKVLVENGHYKTAKAYILYREQHRQLREVKNLLLDVGNIVDSYIAQEDWRIRENANATWSFSGLLWHVTGTVMAYYALNLVYPKEIAKAHTEGDFHLHNLSMSLAGYCAGWSLRQLLHEGFNGVPGKVESSPPKHLRSALGQMVNFIGTLQNEWAGAQAFSSFDTYLAPFVRADRLSYAEVKQAIQEFVFGINISSRWGGQTPFSNITLDWTVPEDLKDEHVTIGGKITNDVYGDFQDEMDMINKAFMEVMLEGDAKGRVFTFPIPTYNITKDFDWHSENAELLFEMTAKYGLPYFQNFINSDLKPGDVRAMCCRLQLNLKELRNKTGALFGAGESTGSIGVVTINMPRIGYLSKDENEFFERLDRFMYLAKQALEIKRKIVSRNMDAGLLPYTKRYLGSLKNHFSTIGLVGMNEACLNFLGVSIAEEEGKKFALKTLDFMREKLIEFQEETGHLYNLEATPAEGTAYRLAKIDKKYYPEIITAGNSIPYYTNSTHLPVEYTDDLWFALKHQEDLQVKYTGGTVFHVFLGESPTSEETRILVKKIAENFRIPYFTITPTFSICPNHGYLKGEKSICPICNTPSEVYSRVVGYLRPVKDWNAGKQEEFKERKEFKVKL
jgi:ribonucleoside-triphosphate reductase